MTLVELLVLLLVAGVCGAVGQSLTGFTRGGCMVSIVVGFVGAILGIWLASQLGLPKLLVVTIDGNAFPILWSIVGSALFVAVLGLLAGRRRV